MSILNNIRPLTDNDFDLSADLNKFLRFLKGETTTGDPFLLPENVNNEINAAVKQRSVIRAISNVAYTANDSFSVILDSDNLSVSGWVDNTNIAKDQERNVIPSKSIKLHELFVKVIVPQSTIDDASVSVEEFIKNKLIVEIAKMENKAILNGTGNNEPFGLLNARFQEEKAPNEEVVQCVRGNLDVDTLYSLLESLHSSYVVNAHWLMSRNVANAVRNFKDESGRMLWQSSIAAGIPDTLLGYPVAICDDMPIASNTQRPVILFGDFYSAYQIVEKSATKLIKDSFSIKPMVEFFATKRIGAAITNYDAIKGMFI